MCGSVIDNAMMKVYSQSYWDGNIVWDMIYVVSLLEIRSTGMCGDKKVRFLRG